MTHICGRRREGGPMSDPAKTGPDEYRDGRCTYCGSMSAQDFMHAVVEGKVIGPSDKSYKFYISEAVSEADQAAHRQQMIEIWISRGLTAAQATAHVDQDALGAHGSHVGKFYTQHLTESQGWEFWNMHQLGKVNWGYPGYPYVPLYIPGPSTQKDES